MGLRGIWILVALYLPGMVRALGLPRCLRLHVLRDKQVGRPLVRALGLIRYLRFYLLACWSPVLSALRSAFDGFSGLHVKPTFTTVPTPRQLSRNSLWTFVRFAACSVPCLVIRPLAPMRSCMCSRRASLTFAGSLPGQGLH